MLVVDVETGGLSPKENPLLSIGAVYFEEPENRFYGECNTSYFKTVTPQALEVNGLNMADIQKQQSPKALLESFFEFSKYVSSFTIAGENPAFDRDFIFETAKEYKIKHNFSHRTVDLHSLVYAYLLHIGEKVPLKDQKNKLHADKSYEYLGLPAEERPHNALNGALIEAEAFSRVIYGKNLIPEFKEYEIPEKLLKYNNIL